jgi:D-amino-acid dehydrogenase
MTNKRVVVVGGGVIGVCCAYYVSKCGAQVTLIERKEIGSGASFGNAGAIAPGHGPLNKPGKIKHALKQMLDSTGPLYIAPRWDPSLARWLWAFHSNCTEERFRSGMVALAPLSHATWELLNQLVQEEALDCNYRAEGYYELCRTTAGLDEAHKTGELMRENDFPAQNLSGDALRAREPTLRENVVGGVYFPQSATCDPHRFLLEMAERVRRNTGELLIGHAVVAVLSQNGKVKGVRTDNDEILQADAVVLATGAYSLELLRKLGWRLPIQAGKGYHRDLKVGNGGAPPLGITCVFSETSVFCTPMNAFVRFAGTMEFSGVNHKIRRSRLEQLTSEAAHYLQKVETSESHSEWCGLRPCTPDGLPVIGPVPGHAGLFVATGHGMLGLTLAPVTGKLIAEYILDGRPSIEVGQLGIGRFR